MAAFVPVLIPSDFFGVSGGDGSSSLSLTSGVGAEPDGALVGAAVMNGPEAVVVVAVVVALLELEDELSDSDSSSFFVLVMLK